MNDSKSTINIGQDVDKKYTIYSGSYGYDVAYRIDGNKIYSGGSGCNIAYRITEKIIAP